MRSLQTTQLILLRNLIIIHWIKIVYRLKIQDFYIYEKILIRKKLVLMRMMLRLTSSNATLVCKVEKLNEVISITRLWWLKATKWKKNNCFFCHLIFFWFLFYYSYLFLNIAFYLLFFFFKLKIKIKITYGQSLPK